MRVQFTPARTALIGTAILMACACGAGANSAKLLKMGGIDVTSKVTHSFILSVGALLIFRGLWQIQRRAAFFAAISFITLAAAAALTPPMMMSAAHEPWQGLQIVGGLLYLIFAAFLVYGFWIAFPTSTMARPAAKAIALAGTAASMGCACCMVTGAIAGLAVTAGGSPDLFLSHGFTYFSAIAVAAVGLAMFRGFRPIPWLISGALLTHYGSHAIGIFDDWMGGDVNLRFIPVYMMYITGAALVMKAWAVAYEPITDAEQIATSTIEPAF
jgi:hypothetical protein